MKAFNINLKKGIEELFTYLKDKVQTFTPDDDFRSYINIDTNEPVFSKGEGDYLNYCMSKSVQFCNGNDLEINDLIDSIQEPFQHLSNIGPIIKIYHTEQNTIYENS